MLMFYCICRCYAANKKIYGVCSMIVRFTQKYFHLFAQPISDCFEKSEGEY